MLLIFQQEGTSANKDFQEISTFGPMILYNVTVNIDDDVHLEWIEWMRKKHVPEVMKTGLFVKNKVCKIIDPQQDGTTYSFQYFCRSIDDYKKYQQEFAPKLQAEHSEKYKDKFVAFRTVMEVVDESWNPANN